MSGSLRAEALHVECRKCGVPPGVKCSRKSGDARKSVHRERIADSRRDKSVVVSDVASVGDFYASAEWRRVRYDALKKHGGCCQLCGERWAPCAPLHVDHIKPRSCFPHLALDVDNLQVLCRACNLGKSNRDQTDWRR